MYDSLFVIIIHENNQKISDIQSKQLSRYSIWSHISTRAYSTFISIQGYEGLAAKTRRTVGHMHIFNTLFFVIKLSRRLTFVCQNQAHGRSHAHFQPLHMRKQNPTMTYITRTTYLLHLVADAKFSFRRPNYTFLINILIKMFRRVSYV